MKFKEYLTETADISMATWNELSTTLIKNCQPFIKELRGARSLLYRGVRVIPKTYDKKSPRSDRKPRLLDTELHDILNKETKKMFGWNTRSEGVFTTNNYGNAKSWGKPAIIFPIGNFKYIWNKNTYNLYNLYDSWFDDDDILQEILKELKDYKSTNLSSFLRNPDFTVSEAIIKCKSYYLINPVWKETLLAYFSEGRDKK